ncbi:asparaginase domain-containing protein [Marinobacter sp. JSM 1782161]|uniref:asparaginase domain-containing protein n=1 Tax=Marinobacter sp. JSM 1782161 TaxID=2685906 RepID=UPI001403F495|nr:asparaginase domain-containing protein [Marinobacter sp. JSM 1782161]
MSRRVLVLYCGGTIGMVPSLEGYVPQAGFGDRVRAELAGVAGQLPDYDLFELDQLIDSANLTPQDWSGIAGMLLAHWAGYDGFVLLHGTDTMAYTAAALSYMLLGADKPVILTGSQIPLGQPRNDALDNLTSALMLAANPAIAEVCIYFRGKLLRGNRARKVNSTAFEAFDSPNAPPLGQLGIELTLRDDLLLAPGQPDFRVPTFDPAAVVMLGLYPGIPARLVEAALDDPRVRGLILVSYGVGNPPDGDEALMAALGRAIERGVIVVNLTQCQQGPVCQGAYATGATLNRLGVVPGYDLTPEAAFAKLHFLLALDWPSEEIRDVLPLPLCQECSLAP